MAEEPPRKRKSYSHLTWEEVKNTLNIGAEDVIMVGIPELLDLDFESELHKTFESWFRYVQSVTYSEGPSNEAESSTFIEMVVILMANLLKNYQSRPIKYQKEYKGLDSISHGPVILLFLIQAVSH